MRQPPFPDVQVLAFDIFGTVVRTGTTISADKSTMQKGAKMQRSAQQQSVLSRNN